MYVVHVVDKETRDEGYLRGRQGGQRIVRLENATYYPHPSSAKRALNAFVGHGRHVGTIVDAKSFSAPDSPVELSGH